MGWLCKTRKTFVTGLLLVFFFLLPCGFRQVGRIQYLGVLLLQQGVDAHELPIYMEKPLRYGSLKDGWSDSKTARSKTIPTGYTYKGNKRYLQKKQPSVQNSR